MILAAHLAANARYGKLTPACDQRGHVCTWAITSGLFSAGVSTMLCLILLGSFCALERRLQRIPTGNVVSCYPGMLLLLFCYDDGAAAQRIKLRCGGYEYNIINYNNQ
jgi:hypothetical protein